jgi:hypothetical protein
MAQNQSEIRYLTPPTLEVKRKNTVVLRRIRSNTLIIKIQFSLKNS